MRDRRLDNELTTAEIKDILLQLRKEDCFELIFTGGEVFLRKDAFEILRFAKELEFAISVFSNGILLNEEKVKQLKELRLNAMQISLYGASKQVHESVTQVKGSFDKTINSIKLLKKHKVPFRIATIVCNKNFYEISLLKKIAKQNNWDINFDFIIFPTLLNGDSPLSLRATDGQLKTASQENLLAWGRDLKKTNGRYKEISEIGFNNWYHANLSSTGKVYPSGVLRIEIGDLRKDTFHNIWENSPRLKWLRSFRKEDFECFHCRWYNDCCWSMDLAFLEHRNFKTAPKEMCRINRIFQEYRRGGGDEKRETDKQGHYG